MHYENQMRFWDKQASFLHDGWFNLKMGIQGVFRMLIAL